MKGAGSHRTGGDRVPSSLFFLGGRVCINLFDWRIASTFKNVIVYLFVARLLFVFDLRSPALEGHALGDLAAAG